VVNFKTQFLYLLTLFINLLSACVSTQKEVSPIPTIPSTIFPANALLAYWSPSPSDSFQVQLSDYPPDLSAEADVFELDLFDTPKETIDSLHKAGKKVICYINVGAWEEYRSDANDFPAKVIGNKYIGWEGERWLDISNYKSFSNLIRTRFDMAFYKECDGVDTDNIHGFQENTGFSITAQDQLAFNIWLSEQAHVRGLSIGLKNNSDQVPDLVDYFDFAVLEDCTIFDECAYFQPFIQHGKAVFQIEYTDNFSSLNDFCEISNKNNYFGLLKHRDLDAWIQMCDLFIK